MVNNECQVAISGMAWTTALGDDLESVWENLCNEESGIKEVNSVHKLRNMCAAKISFREFSNLPEERLCQITEHTINNALINANLTSQDISTAYLILGTSFGSRLEEKNNNTLNEWAERISEKTGFKDRCISISTACSSSSDAILLGSLLINSGYTDICICGGADLLTDSKRLAHSVLKTMSPTLLKAFDKNHDGTILGEGAGILIMVRSSYALKRNINIHAYLRGCGSANDAYGLTAPEPNALGAEFAIKKSLLDAGLKAEEITLYNAHGSGTIINDNIEMSALKKIFINHNLTIFSTKGSFGHTLGATGALEAIALIQALKTKIVPPIAHLKCPFDNIPFNLVYGSKIKVDANIGLSLTLGFGGFDTSLIFEVKNNA